MCSSSMEGLEAAKKDLTGDLVCMQCDMSDPESVNKLAADVIAEHGGVDALVNNAGVYEKGNATEGDPDAWARMMRINVDAPMRLTRLLTEKMVAQKKGVVINVASIAGMESMSGTSAAYAASKHALWGWSRSIYTSLRHANIKVMCINPALTSTDMVRAAGNLNHDRMIQTSDLAQVAMLPYTLSAGCVPEEITLRLTLSAY